jgi:hypothetical protein
MFGFDLRQAHVAGIAVAELVARPASVFGHRTAKIDIGADHIGIGLDTVLVIEIANPRGVMQQPTKRDLRAEGGEQGKVRRMAVADRVIGAKHGRDIP